LSNAAKFTPSDGGVFVELRRQGIGSRSRCVWGVY
jgi:signal transduction histidine kinase